MLVKALDVRCTAGEERPAGRGSPQARWKMTSSLGVHWDGMEHSQEARAWKQAALWHPVIKGQHFGRKRASSAF